MTTDRSRGKIKRPPLGKPGDNRATPAMDPRMDPEPDGPPSWLDAVLRQIAQLDVASVDAALETATYRLVATFNVLLASNLGPDNARRAVAGSIVIVSSLSNTHTQSRMPIFFARLAAE